MSQLLKAVEAACQTLHWSSLGELYDALNQWAPGTSVHTGADDGYNLDCSIDEDGRIRGGCGYGSVIEGDALEGLWWRVESCGGHWVRAEVGRDGMLYWSTDLLPSTSSWGDGEKPDLAARVRRLEEARATLA